MPILTSLVTCALCGVYGDWYCFAMILLGIAGGLVRFGLLRHRVRGLLLHPSETSARPADSDFAEGGETATTLDYFKHYHLQ